MVLGNMFGIPYGIPFIIKEKGTGTSIHLVTVPPKPFTRAPIHGSQSVDYSNATFAHSRVHNKDDAAAPAKVLIRCFSGESAGVTPFFASRRSSAMPCVSPATTLLARTGEYGTKRRLPSSSFMRRKLSFKCNTNGPMRRSVALFILPCFPKPREETEFLNA
jgi:hypothetical protein